MKKIETVEASDERPYIKVGEVKSVVSALEARIVKTLMKGERLTAEQIGQKTCCAPGSAKAMLLIIRELFAGTAWEIHNKRSEGYLLRIKEHIVRQLKK